MALSLILSSKTISYSFVCTLTSMKSKKFSSHTTPIYSQYESQLATWPSKPQISNPNSICLGLFMETGLRINLLMMRKCSITYWPQSKSSIAMQNYYEDYLIQFLTSIAFEIARVGTILHKSSQSNWSSDNIILDSLC